MPQQQQQRQKQQQQRPQQRGLVGLPKGVQRGTADSAFLRPGLLPLPCEDSGPFTVLGIETSCDDTGVAVVSSDGAILGEAIASQAALHEEWGGVVPGLARDAHATALNATIAEALTRAGMRSAAEVDAIAVTVGPGLEICLRVGCEGAKALALEHSKPFVGVHHLEAHVLMARLAARASSTMAAASRGGGEAADGGSGDEAAGAEQAACEVPFPFLTLLTSGGHCQLLLTHGVGRHEVLGSTLDDALGEAFDKVARLLGLPIGGGGGPALEALAREGEPSALPLPVPMQRRKNLDFSFAGLKTAVRVAVERTPEETRSSRAFHADVAASFQHAAFSHLEQRLKYAFAYCDSLHQSPAADDGNAPPAAAPPTDAPAIRPRTLVVSGGVAANHELRRRLQTLCDSTPAPGSDSPWQLVLPPPRLCTDNGVMVAWAAVEALRLGRSHAADGQLVRARWPLGRLVSDASSALPNGTPSKRPGLRKGTLAE